MKNLLNYINENSDKKEYTDEQVKELIESLVENYNGKYVEGLRELIKGEKQNEE